MPVGRMVTLGPVRYSRNTLNAWKNRPFCSFFRARPDAVTGHDGRGG